MPKCSKDYKELDSSKWCKNFRDPLSASNLCLLKKLFSQRFYTSLVLRADRGSQKKKKQNLRYPGSPYALSK